LVSSPRLTDFLTGGALPGLPFPIRKLQCDNGHEFPSASRLVVQALGIRHRYIKPRRPQQNGKVERRHRIDQQEFLGAAPIPGLHCGRCRSPRLGEAVQLRAILLGHSWAYAGREARDARANVNGLGGGDRHRSQPRVRGSILTRPNTQSERGSMGNTKPPLGNPEKWEPRQARAPTGAALRANR
jgi:transposase InsO family protein